MRDCWRVRSPRAAYRRFRELAPEARGGERLALLWLFLRVGAAIPLLAWAVRRWSLPTLLRRLTPAPTARLPRGAPRAAGTARSVVDGGPWCPARPWAGGTPALPAFEDTIARFVDYWLSRRCLWYQPTCLLRALTLYRFLREAGVPVVIHYGVAREGGTAPTGTAAKRWSRSRLTGHSWLTLRSRPYLELGDPETRFRRVYSYPPLEKGKTQETKPDAPSR